MFEALQGLVYIASAVFVLGLVVLVHEYGHYQVGRWCGIGVERFSIGFGPELFAWTGRNGTRWRLAAFPLGGYVKFTGDRDVSGASPADEDSRPDAFQNKALWQRAATVAAGPAANFVLAVAVLASLFFIFGETRTEPRAFEVVSKSPAAEAGIAPGDLFLRANGKKIKDFRDLQRVIALSSGTTIPVVVSRGGREVTLTVTPERVEVDDGHGGTQRMGRLGVSGPRPPDGQVDVDYGPLGAVARGAERTLELAGLQLRFLGRLVSLKESVQDIGGPLGIAHLSGRAASSSYEGASGGVASGVAAAMVTLIQLAAAVSVSVGLLNLLPIPILDGGHLAFYAYEAVAGRPLGPRAQEFGYRVGLALLLAVFVIATFSDLHRFGLFGE